MAFLLLFINTFSIYNIQQATHWLNITYDDIISQLQDWSWFIVHQAFYTTMTLSLGQYLWLALITIIQVLFCGPIVIYSFYESVYNYGPVWRSFMDIMLIQFHPKHTMIGTPHARFLDQSSTTRQLATDMSILLSPVAFIITNFLLYWKIFICIPHF